MFSRSLQKTNVIRIIKILDIKIFLSFVNQTINQTNINITNCKTTVYSGLVNKIAGKIIDI